MKSYPSWFVMKSDPPWITDLVVFLRMAFFFAAFVSTFYLRKQLGDFWTFVLFALFLYFLIGETRHLKECLENYFAKHNKKQEEQQSRVDKAEGP